MASKLTNKQLSNLMSELVGVGQQARRSASRNAKQTTRSRGPRGPSRRQRKNRSNLAVLQGSSKMFQSSEPVAVDTCMANPTYMGVVGQVSHNDFGNGIRVEGRQLLVDITTVAAATSDVFGSSGTATATSVNTVQLSPDSLNGRLALQARNYSRYAFRNVRLHYVPRVATSDVGQLAIGYSTDAAEAGFATNTFASTTTLSPSMVTPFRKEMKMEITYKGDLTWFTEVDATSNGSIRQCAQGVIIGFPDAAGIGAIQHGWLWVEYVIDLYGQNADYGFTLTLRSEEERKIASESIRRHRAIMDSDLSSVSSIDDCGTRARVARR